MKINNFRGELTDISAKKEALAVRRAAPARAALHTNPAKRPYANVNTLVFLVINVGVWPLNIQQQVGDAGIR